MRRSRDGVASLACSVGAEEPDGAAGAGAAVVGGGAQEPSRDLPRDPWELGLEGGIWVPPYSRDPRPE